MQTKNELMSVDQMMDERFGAVGTPEREAFRKEAYAFCAGQIIADARRRERVTQAELATALGINKSYIYRIEHGYIEPSISLFVRMLNALNMRIDISPTMA